ncbi:MAG TPA: pyrroloquinoline quinone-dependent dehydrogenase [Caulobacteraceae bacterium]|nr:pyrroloquinoline quinone-dependent dehydrogenase [Caulobacteraceae bacterium]
MGANAFVRALAVAAIMAATTACAPKVPRAPPAPDVDWPYYGADPGGQRFSSAAQVTAANVRALKVAWTFSTGDAAGKGRLQRDFAFENTPILAGGRLYVCASFNEVSALDPGSGKPLWRFDPGVDPHVQYPNSYNCRGVAYWRDPGTTAANAPCAARIFMNTNDRRLFALDAATGKVCPGFGDHGVVDVARGVPLVRPGEFQITSPPVVVRGVVVVGSSLDDNQRVREVSGAVRAYDAATGQPRWSFDPLAGANPPIVAGAANVWAPMSADEAAGLVFLPTTSPSPDFWGGLRPGDDANADSVVALKAETGEVAWAFKTVHHDVWDYDNPAQPTLGVVTYEGQTRPAVLQPTKQGLLFTLDRQTGKPLIPVEERAVPQGGAPGEVLSPTQPFPVAPAPLAPSRITANDAWGLTPWERDACRKAIAGARAEGLYTPPSLQGTILYPFTGGGANWGGLAFDAAHDVAYVNTSSALHLVKLIPAARVRATRQAELKLEVSAQEGAPYGMSRRVLLSPIGLPCNPPPWGLLHAIDMRDGHQLWAVPLGTTQDKAPGSQLVMPHAGMPSFGGPIVTAGGLVFIGGTLDNYLRAFDAASGRELWRGRLPAGGQATPMTYVWKGRQYVVIAAGGHAKSDTKRGDNVVAFALP